MSDQKLLNREISYDLLRICAVIAVVFTHVGVSNTSGAKLYDSVFDIITRWAVPCFVMISGRFFLDPKREINARKLLSSMIRILSAAIFWNLIYQVYYYCTGYYDGLNLKGIIFSGVLTGPYHFWYVWMILALYAITPILRAFCTNKRLMQYFIVLFFIGEFFVLYSVSIPGIGGTFEKFITDAHFHLALGFSGYYVLGYYLYHIRLNKTRRIIVYSLGIGMLLVTCILEYLIDSNRIATDISVNDYLSPNIALISIAVFVFFTSRSVSRLTVSDKTKSIISKIANCTFGIYLIHALFIYLLSGSILYSDSVSELIMRPLRTIIIFVFSLIVIMIIKKLPWIGKHIT